jgi:DNA invertase Pin-like site-specific DNA recombinase/adenylate kinase family enzyme
MTLTQIPAMIYTRRSRISDDQASVEDQESHGRAAVAEHGWQLAGVLSEEVSASRYGTKERGGWAELLRRVRAREVGVLVLWEADRGSRTLTQWSAFLDICRETETGIHIVSHERLYDVRRHADWKTLADAGVDGAYFSEKQSVNVRRGKRAAMHKGRPASPVPYGFTVHYRPETGVTAGWRIVPERAAIVREILYRVARAQPVARIAADLNARGIASPMGRLWDRSSVRQVASNPAYAGLVRLHDGRYAPRQPQKDGAEWPPIVERAEWEAAVAVLSSRATGQRPGAARHLLSGIAKCECGAWLKAHKGTGYECRNNDLHVMKEPLEEWVRDVICERLSRDDARDMFIRDDTPRMVILGSEVKELEERRSGFRRKAALGAITEDALAEVEATIGDEIARREREMATVRNVPALAGAIGAADVRAWWDDQELQAQREVIAAVTSVTVLKVPRRSTWAARADWAERVVLDWVPQPPKRGPGGRDTAKPIRTPVKP